MILQTRKTNIKLSNEKDIEMYKRQKYSVNEEINNIKNCKIGDISFQDVEKELMKIKSKSK